MTAAVILRAAWRFGRANPVLIYLAAAALALALSYWRGGVAAECVERAERAERTVEIHEMRREARDAAISADDLALCVSLGGVRDDCERGLRGAGAPADPE